MGQYLKDLFDSTKFTIGGLGGLYILGWLADGYLGLKFDLPELRQFIIYIYGIQLAKHTVNSTVNSPKGEFPQANKVEGGKTI